jgi:hypothetical protein
MHNFFSNARRQSTTPSRAHSSKQLFRPARLADRVKPVPCRFTQSGPTTLSRNGTGLVSAGTRPRQQFFAPMLYVNGAKIAISPEGSAFYRDYAPRTYVFSIESCGPGPQPSQQLTVGANQQFALQVQNDDTAPSDCLVYYFTRVTPQMVPVVFAPLRYLAQN